MKNSRSVILVGGYGFIGRNIIEALLSDPDYQTLKPVVIDDLSNAVPEHETLELEHYLGAYQDEGASKFCQAQTSGHEGGKPKGRIFVFLAGETRVAESKDRPLDFIEANITAPSRFVMNAVNENDHFILVSTAGALFDGTSEVRNESAYCPKNFYGASKAAEEMILEKLVELRGAHFSVVRLTNVYGPFSDNKKSAIHAFTRATISGDPVFINGDGKQSRDFIYSGDVGRSIAKLASKLSAGEPIQKINMLAAGTSTSLMDVVEAIESAAGGKLNYTKIPAAELLSTEPRDVIACADDTRAILNGEITPLKIGVQKTFAYYEAKSS